MPRTWRAVNPIVSAPATLAALSSRKSTSTGATGSLDATSSKISSSGLTIPSSKERKRNSKALPMGAPSKCVSHWNALVLERQPTRAASRTVATSSTAPGYGPPCHPPNASRKAAGSRARPQSPTTPAANSSGEQRPASKARTQRQLSQRDQSSSSLPMPASARMGPTPPGSTSTPPRSKSTNMRVAAMAVMLRAGRRAEV